VSTLRSRLSAFFWSLQSYTWDDYLDLPACRSDIEATAAWLAEHLTAEARRVLDVGCGTGNYTLALAARGCQATGIDFSTGMLRRARAKAARAACGASAKPGAGSAAFEQADFDRGLPFPSRSFDAVLAVAVLQCAADPLALLTEIRRVLQPPGVLLLVVLDPERRSWAKRPLRVSLSRLALRWLKALGSNSRRVPRYGREELSAWLARAGFELVEERTGQGTLGLLCQATEVGK
jgi:ubiquinone/menaquinone biosynthesis C-methylase UbiE